MTDPTLPIATVERLADFSGQRVTLRGWLYHMSSKGKLHFAQLRDGTGIVQCVVFKNNVSPDFFEAVGRMGQESSFSVTGLVKPDARAPGGFEIDVDGGTVHHSVEGYPITPKEHGTDFLLSQRHLWLRSKRPWAILRIRDAAICGLRRFFEERGFLCVDSPMFTPNACEGTTNLFEVDYFDSKVYLTQSGQLYSEATAMAFGKVYCFGPTFRAEKSKTRRHLTEFWMLEPEVAYASLEDVMVLAEEMVTYAVRYVLERRRPELESLGRDISKLEAIEPPFPRLTYDEASEILRATPGSEFVHGSDFGAPDETVLSNRFEKPVFVHRYPVEVKAFYMKRDAQRPDRALCVDMLGTEGVGELIGGGQREDDLDQLLHRIQEHGLPQQFFEWYLDLRRYGTVPHAGFGLGLERFVGWIAGIEHVRECIPFPRTMYRFEP